MHGKYYFLLWSYFLWRVSCTVFQSLFLILCLQHYYFHFSFVIHDTVQYYTAGRVLIFFCELWDNQHWKKGDFRSTSVRNVYQFTVLLVLQYSSSCLKRKKTQTFPKFIDCPSSRVLLYKQVRQLLVQILSNLTWPARGYRIFFLNSKWRPGEKMIRSDNTLLIH